MKTKYKKNGSKHKFKIDKDNDKESKVQCNKEGNYMNEGLFRKETQEK